MINHPDASSGVSAGIYKALSKLLGIRPATNNPVSYERYNMDEKHLDKFKQAKYGEDIGKNRARQEYAERDSGRDPESVGGFDNLIELRIKKAQAEGQFDNLKGKGQPQDMNKYYEAPEHLRVGFHVLGNAGFLPEEVRLSKEIETTKEKLSKAETEEERSKLYKELSDLTSKFNMCIEYNRKFKKQLY
jgi:hypothetical protein